MRNFSPSPTHLPNIIKVGHTVLEKCSGQKNHGRRTAHDARHTAHGARRTDISITKSLPELSSGKIKKRPVDRKETNPLKILRRLEVKK